MTARTWCWPFRHLWSKWWDTDHGERQMINLKGEYVTIGNFVMQERRCERCGAVQLRTEYT